MPHQVKTVEELDFVIGEASRTLGDNEIITLRTFAMPEDKVKLKFKTKSKLFVFITDAKTATKVEDKYPKVKKI